MTFKCIHDPLGRTCVPAADTGGTPFAGQRLKRIVCCLGFCCLARLLCHHRVSAFGRIGAKICSLCSGRCAADFQTVSRLVSLRFNYFARIHRDARQEAIR
ncbi:CO dehydrogenase/acetyl-CoA synthase alpha subunit [Pseudomonas syringae pv. actinidiae]|uniref:CO dehydrogenase/acetyl-CoA synthase alpha subunit n=1 Tax=Pseudomonas syringae pv. actinidiae TaxID=103796 RepID=A0A2V0Q651_PSESF|nr:CO dehydrogenase/acetyl-CoA synthase alpha subunit [Pseudomonas syringae pv. actinidiae]